MWHILDRSHLVAKALPVLRILQSDTPGRRVASCASK